MKSEQLRIGESSKSKKSIVAYLIIHKNEDFRFRFRTTSSSTLRIYNDKIAALLYMYEDDNARACKLSHASCLKSLTVIYCSLYLLCLNYLVKKGHEQVEKTLEMKKME